MKRFAGMAALLILIAGSLGATNVIVELKVQYFSPTDQVFRDIYGGGMMYGGEVSVGVWKGLEAWLGGSYFSSEGELTFTKEKTELEIVPIEVGLRYRWAGERFSFYAGGGLSFQSYKESNPIGDISLGGTGFMAEIGSYVRITGGLLFDLFVNYTGCRLESPDFDIDIGGFAAGVGLAYEF
jgi:hypothetical protein